ncbi:MAG TPA: hypothetical protein VHC19_26265 [Pirellulales bacterium]|nr:hypothetical protein [Pirellulales bacterium]
MDESNDPSPAAPEAEVEAAAGPSAWQRFWQRYSPYGEFPRSSATSLTFHLLVVLLLILLSGTLVPRERTAPAVDVVQVGDDANAAPGDGDGLPAAGDELSATPAASGAEMPLESLPNEEVNTAVEPAETAAARSAQTAADLAADAASAVQSASSAAQQARRSLDRAKQQLAKNQNGQGGGGNAEAAKGGTVSATGTGGGGGAGPSGRAARTGRWVLHFRHASYPDLLAQYQGIGAELAFPAPNDQYRYFSQLTSRPPHSHLGDLAKETRLYWLEEDGNTVSGLARVLGIAPTSYMLAFLPQTLEDNMLKRELAYGNLKEDQIAKTEFEVVRRGGGYDVIVVSQTPK